MLCNAGKPEWVHAPLSYLGCHPTHALLFAGGRFLDGRVWPLEDELEVRLMIDLIRHVTGA